MHVLCSTSNRLTYRTQTRSTSQSQVFKRFKTVADRKKVVSDEDLQALLNDEAHQPAVIWELVGVQASAFRTCFRADFDVAGVPPPPLSR